MYRLTDCRLFLFLIIIGIFACQDKTEESNCHAQITEEFYYPVDSAGVSPVASSYRRKLRCAGLCPDGTPCDSILELTNTSMGYPVRRVRCGCKSNPSLTICDIMLETTRYEGDTVATDMVCVSYTEGCPVAADRCLHKEKVGPTDTIKSVISRLDSLVIRRKIHTCECMSEGEISED